MFFTRLARFLHKHEPPWYGKLEQLLAPVQWVVVPALLVLAGLAILIAVKGPNWLRTAYLVYLVSP